MNGIGQRAGAGFANEQMDVLGHDNVAVDEQRELFAGPLKSFQEQRANRWGIQPCLPPITTEGYEMRLPRVLQPYQPLRHEIHFTARVNECKRQTGNPEGWRVLLPTLTPKPTA